jgi:hypothetical protein
MSTIDLAIGLGARCPPRWSQAGIVSVARIGECHAPGTIQAAVYAGHKLARGLDEAPEGELPRELPGSPNSI